jgi:hypothetical protein
LSGDRLFTSATRTAVPCSRPDSFCALPSMRSRQLLNRASLMAGSRSSRLRQMGGAAAGQHFVEWERGAVRQAGGRAGRGGECGGWHKLAKPDAQALTTNACRSARMPTQPT